MTYTYNNTNRIVRVIDCSLQHIERLSKVRKTYIGYFECRSMISGWSNNKERVQTINKKECEVQYNEKSELY